MAIAIRGTTPASTSGAGDPTSLTLTGAQQPQDKDVLLIIHSNDFYAQSNIPTPTVGGSTTGVTPATSADGGTNGAHSAAWTFVCSSTGDRTVAVDETGAADEDKALIVYVLSGVDNANPVDQAAGAVNTGSTTHNAPSLTGLSTSDAYLICHTNTGGGASSGSYTPPSGMSESYDFVASSGGMSAGGAVLQLASSGATGTKTFSPAGSCANNSQLSIAMRTASAGAAADSSGWSAPARLPGVVGPDGQVFLPNRFDDVTSVGATNANAGQAAGTGTANNPQPSVAPAAGQASATGAAQAPTASVKPTASQAAATGAANNPQPATAPTAGQASGTGAAQAPTRIVAPVIGTATATGTAFNATVSTGSATNAAAGTATATGTANGAGPAVAPVPAAATATGTAQDPSRSVATTPTTATATGTAFGASISHVGAIEFLTAGDLTVTVRAHGLAPTATATGLAATVQATDLTA